MGFIASDFSETFHFSELKLFMNTNSHRQIRELAHKIKKNTDNYMS